MTHFEKMKALYVEMGLKFKEYTGSELGSYFKKMNPDCAKVIEIETGIGYAGILGYFLFDCDGKFLTQGLFE